MSASFLVCVSVCTSVSSSDFVEIEIMNATANATTAAAKNGRKLQ